MQERAIPILLDGRRDLIITAGTASGKTEAAFLPIVSRLATESIAPGAGFRAVYVGPLRALINDQFGRMESLCAGLDIQVAKWHGDVSAAAKAKARKQPDGILLITPESLEAILVRRGNEGARLFRALSFVVIDEMHAFLDDPRGKQLQSILYRIDLASRARPVRVGLSATLADEDAPRAFLRPLDPSSVMVLPPGSTGQELRLQIRGYIRPLRLVRRQPEEGTDEASRAPVDPAETELVRHLFDTHRGRRSLIFGSSRGRVETVAVRLAEMTAAAALPDEFIAHHGSLSREHREEAERRMRDRSRPASIVCTTTLELGIDVGEIECVAQLGPGHTVSGMRQRLGRSGRRPGQSAIMRIYVTEPELDERTPALDALRLETVQAVAMVNLMLRRWNEPPALSRLHLSTLLHQVLTLIAQRGGARPEEIWRDLVASGVFASVDQTLFKALLRRMGHPEVGLLEQAPDGTLLPGPEGERLIESRDIYSVFLSPEEFRIVADGGRTVGQVPAINPIVAGQLLILAGRRWRVIDVDTRHREALVRPASGGNPPLFDSTMRPPSDGVIAEMRRVYEEVQVPRFLDPTAVRLLAEARTSFDRLGLRHLAIARDAGQLLLFPWVGERQLNALRLALARADLAAEPLGIALAVAAKDEDALAACLGHVAGSPPPDPRELAALAGGPQLEKFDRYLGDELLTYAYASEHLDVSDLPGIAFGLVQALRRVTPES